MGKLTALAIQRQKTPGRYGDGGGLWLQVSAAGGRSWLFRYTLAGKARHMGLGPADIVSLADAREAAREQRRLLLAGIDPLDHRRAAKAAAVAKSAAVVTFSEAADRYIESHAAGWRSEKHAHQWASTLETYAHPILGPISVAAIDTSLVIKVLEPIWRDKPETASRVRGRVEAVLAWAGARNMRTGDNPARWRGHLDQLLPPRQRIKRVRHHAALPFRDLPRFMSDLALRDCLSARALEFTVLTAARTGETIFAKPDEVNIPSALWTVPAGRIKGGREHRVPLPERAVEIILQNAGRSFLFETDSRRPLSNMAMLELLRGMRPGFTVHGFRSTFSDWVSEQTQHSRDVREMALAHAVGDEVEASYRRGDLFDKRRALMRDWALFCYSRKAGEK